MGTRRQGSIRIFTYAQRGTHHVDTVLDVLATDDGELYKY